ncbi:MAG: hypothetical protein ABI333_11540 [bacterium]
MALLLTCGLLLAACPEIQADPTSGPQGAESMIVDVFGTNTSFVQGQTTATFSRPGEESGIEVVGEPEVVSGTHLRLTVNIPANEPEGDQTLTVSTGSETAETTFTVTSQPTMSISPSSGEQGEPGLIVSLVGVNTHFAQATLAPKVNILGVSAVDWVVTDDTHAEVVLEIELSAPIGAHQGAFQVFSDYQTLAADFEILPVTGRSITLNPTSGEQGQAVTVDVTGVKTAFDEGVVVSLDPPADVNVVGWQASSPTALQVELLIHSNAAVGPRDLVVEDPYGTLAAELSVTADPTPPQVSYVPHVAHPGETLTVQAEGTNTSFQASETWVEVVPDDGLLTMAIIDVPGTDQVVLEAMVSPEAEELEYQVALHTGAEHATGSFWVVPEPSIALSVTQGHQDSSVQITVTGQHTHFQAGGTQAVAAAGSGLTIESFSVDSPTQARFNLVIAETAPVQVVPDAITLVTDAWLEEPSAQFEVLPGLPRVDLAPTGVEQGRVGFTVTAYGHFTHFQHGVTTVTVDSNCAGDLQVHGVGVTSLTRLSFLVDVELMAQPRACPVEIVTDDGVVHEQLFTQLNILPGYSGTTIIPSDVQGFLDGPQLYALDLALGEVFRARATRDPFTFIDPVLTLYGPNAVPGDLPFAENDDESAATVNPRLVYQAPEAGTYFLVVSDRFGFNTGPYELSLAHFDPEGAAEEAGEPDNDNRSTAEPLYDLLLRGEMSGASPWDYYEVNPAAVPLGDTVAVQVIALDVSPFDTSASDVRLWLWDNHPSHQLLGDLALGSEGPDPVLYAATSELQYIGIENEGLENTVYWLNLRPGVVINEVFHDEANGWTASFVELYGEPGAALGGCSLQGKAHDGLTEVPGAGFDIDLSSHVLGPAGYFVLAHDDLVPGSSVATIDPLLVISEPDPVNLHQTIAISLVCSAVVIDTVCYRGTDFPECEGTAATDTGPLGQSIGRGFHIDTNANDRDFLPQLEPSPWARNVTEVW